MVSEIMRFQSGKPVAFRCRSNVGIFVCACFIMILIVCVRFFMENQKRVHIVHLISPFRVEDCNSLFCPFDQGQSVAIASMRHARQKTERAVISFAAVTFPEDIDVIPDDFTKLAPLQRSTSSEYPHLSKTNKRKLPFIREFFRRRTVVE